ncbi:unnamed protein product, partial [Effrenium voratum]
EEEFVVSDGDISAEDELEELPHHEPPKKAREVSPEEFQNRAPPGTHILLNNGYYSIAHYRANFDCKAMLLSRWCTQSELGRRSMSKTLRVEDYDPDKHIEERAV